MATMKDVARLAGVSTSTVSHVINKDRFVSEAITAKVEAAIKELNYAPLPVPILSILNWCVALNAVALNAVIALFSAIPKAMSSE